MCSCLILILLTFFLTLLGKYSQFILCVCLQLHFWTQIPRTISVFGKILLKFVEKSICLYFNTHRTSKMRSPLKVGTLASEFPSSRTLRTLIHIKELEDAKHKRDCLQFLWAHVFITPVEKWVLATL